MPQDYLSIGCSPADEQCAQVGSDDYDEKSRRECRAFINQLIRVNGEEPVGCFLKVKSFPHDFGSYREVICVYNTDDERCVDYALACENLPSHWDEQALAELRKEASPTK